MSLRPFFLIIGTLSLIGSESSTTAQELQRQSQQICGWQVNVDVKLASESPELTKRALELLETQLQEIVSSVPAAACQQLKQVPLFFSPQYPGIGPRAEFHPSQAWLRDNGRDPKMAQAIEFTNVSIFEQETTRMPNFALHELSHAFHFRFVEGGYANAAIEEAFQRAKAGGKYDSVVRRNGRNRSDTKEKAYAITNEMEYFAELSEAYFSSNDFFPFNRSELSEFDPVGYRIIRQVWQVKD